MKDEVGSAGDNEDAIWETKHLLGSVQGGEVLESPHGKSAPQPKYIWFWVLMNILSSILQYLSLPLWIGSIPSQCSDPFVVYQISATMFVLIFAICVIVLHWINENNFFAFIGKLTVRGMILIMVAGILNAMNGVLVVISSPVDRTPPIISTTLPNIGFLVMIVIIWYMHHRRYLPEPVIKGSDFLTLEFFLFFVMYAVCVYTTVVATNGKSAVLDGQVYWFVIFLLGMFFGYLYNQIQEVFFKTEAFDGSVNDMTNFLFATIIIQWIAALLCTWVDFIPGVNMTPAGDVACGYEETLAHSFTGMGIVWNLLWGLGNWLSYVASVKTNTVNTGLTMLINPISTALIIAISYNIPALTPDKALVDVYFFFPMIFSSILMTYFYTCWYKGTRLSGRLITLSDYFVRYDKKVDADHPFDKDAESSPFQS